MGSYSDFGEFHVLSTQGDYVDGRILGAWDAIVVSLCTTLHFKHNPRGSRYPIIRYLGLG